MKKLAAIFMLLLGLILFLPLVGVTQFGNLIEGTFGWITALFVLAMGVIEIMHQFGK
jgi:hypothetical protein